MKKTLIKLSLALGTIAATFGVGSTANAADFSFRGNFSQDDDVQLFNFSVGASSNVTFRTYSYAGGTQADGTVVASGGFDPILALFDAAGNFINSDLAPISISPVRQWFEINLKAKLSGNIGVFASEF